MVWTALGAACATSAPSGAGITEVWYLNRSAVAVHTEMATRETSAAGVLMSDGSSTADVPPCDVGGARVDLMPGQHQTWTVTVAGSVVLTSDADLPNAGPGEALEILVDIPPEGEPTVRVDTVPARPLDDRSRSEELAAGLDCE